MATEKPTWPEQGDLVIVTVQRITDYGAYVTLDEFDGKEGLLHISEVSSGWVRNIREFVREGQKAVLKVLRVNTEKGQVDLSLRRVSKLERREKILSWKRERKADSLVRTISDKLKTSVNEVRTQIGPVEEKFGGLYEAFERAALEGPDPLVEAGLPKDTATVMSEIAKDKIRPRMVKIKGTVELQCMKPNGIVYVKEALFDAQKVEKPSDAEIRIYTVASPKYAIEVLAEDYKEAEKLLQKASEAAIKAISKAGGVGTFQRGK
jgi:translation initiation factor 2 subunit 1